MSRMLRIVHKLHYKFALPRLDAVATLRMCPLNGTRQRLLHHRVRVSPTATMEMMGRDALGNEVTELVWETAPELTITASSAIELTLGGSRLDDLAPERFSRSTPLAPIAEQFAALGRATLGERGIHAGSLFTFAKKMRSSLHYDARWSAVHRSAGGALFDGEGSHADYAHVAIAVLRSLGHAACYIRGYLLPPTGAGRPEPHAWIAVYSPSRGWLEVDPMLGCPPDLRHVAVAVGRDRSDVAPVESEVLSDGLVHVRRSLAFYPLSHTRIPATVRRSLAS